MRKENDISLLHRIFNIKPGFAPEWLVAIDKEAESTGDADPINDDIVTFPVFVMAFLVLIAFILLLFKCYVYITFVGIFLVIDLYLGIKCQACELRWRAIYRQESQTPQAPLEPAPEDV